MNRPPPRFPIPAGRAFLCAFWLILAGVLPSFAKPSSETSERQSPTESADQDSPETTSTPSGNAEETSTSATPEWEEMEKRLTRLVEDRFDSLEDALDALQRSFEENREVMTERFQEGRPLTQEETEAIVSEVEKRTKKLVNNLEASLRDSRETVTLEVQESIDPLQEKLDKLTDQREQAQSPSPWMAPGIAFLAFLAATTAAAVAYRRPASIPDPATAEPAPVNPPATEELARVEKRLADLESLPPMLASLESRLEHPQSPEADRLSRIESTLATLSDRIPEPPEEDPQVQNPDPTLDMGELLPQPLRSGGRLASWAPKLQSAATEDNPEAIRLLSTLIDWRADNSHNDPKAIAERAHVLGQRLFPCLRKIHDLDQDAVIDAIQTWTKSFKTEIEERAPTLKLVAVYPGDRFDSDRMEAVRSLSSNRLTVSFPLSWLILERADSGEHVLHRAEVITS